MKIKYVKYNLKEGGIDMLVQYGYKDKITFATALDMWLLSNKVRIKHTTYDKYSYIIQKHIVPDLGNLSLAELNSMQINKFLNDKLHSGGIENNKPLAPSYVSTMSLIISSAIHYAANEDLCTDLKNPIYKPIANNKEIHVLNSADYNKLTMYIVSNINETNLGILFALYLGLRIGEICALKWENIDFKTMIIHIKSTVSRINNNGKTKYILDVPKTKSSIRDIPIPKKLFTILKDSFVNRKSDFVISKTDSFVIPRTFEYRYHKLLNELAIESINFHSLRHTFATNCISNGMDVKSLSEILGHTNVNTTLQIYVHPSMEIKRKQIDKVIQ